MEDAESYFWTFVYVVIGVTGALALGLVIYFIYLCCRCYSRQHKNTVPVIKAQTSTYIADHTRDLSISGISVIEEEKAKPDQAT